LNSYWQLQVIPSDWTANTETAVIYTLSGGSDALEDVIATFGVDNGIFVWLDGEFKFGALASGGADPNEYTLNLGNLEVGTHSLQVLREDHGGSTGYYMSVSGETASVPEPSIVSLLGISLLCLFYKSKRK
jgi:hypothetical protein